jgi:TRAP-type C4-dicarboxylate transport system substrate-binding protein
MRKPVACILVAALGMAMAVPGSISPVAAKSGNVLRIATLAPRDTEMTRGFTRIDRGLRSATQNAWGLQLYPSGIAGDEKDVIRKMSIGQMDGAIITDSGLGQIVRDVAVLQAPGVINSYEELERVQKVMNKEWDAAFDKAGFKLIAWGEAGQIRTFSKAPVTKPSDVKGMRPWLWPENYVMRETYRVLGATGVPLDLPEVYGALQTNMVDFVYATPLALVALQWHTKLKYISEETHGVLLGAMIISKKKWDSIPEDVRATLYKQIKENYEGDATATRQDDRKALEKLLQRGFIKSKLSPQGQTELDNLSKQVREHLVGRVYSKELLERVTKIARGG